jgi:hypothetical protein
MKDSLALIGEATITEDGMKEGCISVIRGGDLIYLHVEGQQDIVIWSELQARAVVAAIIGISASQGWKVLIKK